MNVKWFFFFSRELRMRPCTCTSYTIYTVLYVNETMYSVHVCHIHWTVWEWDHVHHIHFTVWEWDHVHHIHCTVWEWDHVHHIHCTILKWDHVHHILHFIFLSLRIHFLLELTILSLSSWRVSHKYLLTTYSFIIIQITEQLSLFCMVLPILELIMWLNHAHQLLMWSI